MVIKCDTKRLVLGTIHNLNSPLHVLAMDYCCDMHATAQSCGMAMRTKLHHATTAFKTMARNFKYDVTTRDHAKHAT